MFSVFLQQRMQWRSDVLVNGSKQWLSEHGWMFVWLSPMEDRMMLLSSCPPFREEEE